MHAQTKKAAPIKGGGLNRIHLLGGLNRYDSSKACVLDQGQIDELLNCLPERANQARRFVRYVGGTPDALTSECNIAVLSVNLSDLAVKYNPYLSILGYELRCRLPEKLIKNRLNEPTMQHLWGLYELGGSNA